ncbi:hypothetical protein [Aeromicrobium camelliae]|uniref:hypothetical protein n=1 Tax=Aeromicrobium camelliae TaxID=1538144 RepID=UPI00140BD523|nr:hypothetical protein [Aeromicrobium camelliae]
MELLGEQLMADHSALLALPALVPAAAVVGAILYIARKDRREEAEEQQRAERQDEGEAR